MPKAARTSPALIALSTASLKRLLDSLSGPRPLVNELPEINQRMANQIISAVDPRDITETFLVSDIIDCSLQIKRFRKARDVYINSCMYLGLQSMIEPELSEEEAEALIQRYRSQGYTGEVKRELKQLGIDEDAILASVLVHKLSTLEKLDATIAGWEERRDKALFQIARGREAQMKRRPAEPFEGEFKELTLVAERGDDA